MKVLRLILLLVVSLEWCSGNVPECFGTGSVRGNADIQRSCHVQGQTYQITPPAHPLLANQQSASLVSMETVHSMKKSLTAVRRKKRSLDKSYAGQESSQSCPFTQQIQLPLAARSCTDNSHVSLVQSPPLRVQPVLVSHCSPTTSNLTCQQMLSPQMLLRVDGLSVHMDLVWVESGCQPHHPTALKDHHLQQQQQQGVLAQPIQPRGSSILMRNRHKSFPRLSRSSRLTASAVAVPSDAPLTDSSIPIEEDSRAKRVSTMKPQGFGKNTQHLESSNNIAESTEYFSAISAEQSTASHSTPMPEPLLKNDAINSSSEPFLAATRSEYSPGTSGTTPEAHKTTSLNYDSTEALPSSSAAAEEYKSEVNTSSVASDDGSTVLQFFEPQSTTDRASRKVELATEISAELTTGVKRDARMTTEANDHNANALFITQDIHARIEKSKTANNKFIKPVEAIEYSTPAETSYTTTTTLPSPMSPVANHKPAGSMWQRSMFVRNMPDNVYAVWSRLSPEHKSKVLQFMDLPSAALLHITTTSPEPSPSTTSTTSTSEYSGLSDEDLVVMYVADVAKALATSKQSTFEPVEVNSASTEAAHHYASSSAEPLSEIMKTTDGFETTQAPAQKKMTASGPTEIPASTFSEKVSTTGSPAYTYRSSNFKSDPVVTTQKNNDGNTERVYVESSTEAILEVASDEATVHNETWYKIHSAILKVVSEVYNSPNPLPNLSDDIASSTTASPIVTTSPTVKRSHVLTGKNSAAVLPHKLLPVMMRASAAADPVSESTALNESDDWRAVRRVLSAFALGALTCNTTRPGHLFNTSRGQKSAEMSAAYALLRSLSLRTGKPSSVPLCRRHSLRLVNQLMAEEREMMASQYKYISQVLADTYHQHEQRLQQQIARLMTKGEHLEHREQRPVSARQKQPQPIVDYRQKERLASAKSPTEDALPKTCYCTEQDIIDGENRLVEIMLVFAEELYFALTVLSDRQLVVPVAPFALPMSLETETQAVMRRIAGSIALYNRAYFDLQPALVLLEEAINLVNASNVAETLLNGTSVTDPSPTNNSTEALLFLPESVSATFDVILQALQGFNVTDGTVVGSQPLPIIIFEHISNLNTSCSGLQSLNTLLARVWTLWRSMFNSIIRFGVTFQLQPATGVRLVSLDRDIVATLITGRLNALSSGTRRYLGSLLHQLFDQRFVIEYAIKEFRWLLKSLFDLMHLLIGVSFPGGSGLISQLAIVEQLSLNILNCFPVFVFNLYTDLGSITTTHVYSTGFTATPFTNSTASVTTNSQTSSESTLTSVDVTSSTSAQPTVHMEYTTSVSSGSTASSSGTASSGTASSGTTSSGTTSSDTTSSDTTSSGTDSTITTITTTALDTSTPDTSSPVSAADSLVSSTVTTTTPAGVDTSSLSAATTVFSSSTAATTSVTDIVATTPAIGASSASTSSQPSSSAPVSSTSDPSSTTRLSSGGPTDSVSTELPIATTPVNRRGLAPIINDLADIDGILS